jgi:nitrate reductase gamma subunit
MNTLLEFARGPLFVATLTFLILGLARQIVLCAAQLRESVRRWSDRKFRLKENIRDLIEWLIPVRHMRRNRPLLSITSFSFHVGLLLVPIFLLDHIALWERALGISWPGIPPLLADGLTLVAIAGACILFGYRLLDAGGRTLSSGADYFLLVALTVPFVSGFMAHHPAVNPFPYQGVMLVHILSSELVFVLIPTTKLAHCVLFPFLRVSSDVFWKMPAGAGETVARELHGEEVRV